MTRPSEKNCSYYQAAYDHLNQTLFNGELPECLVTMRGSRGSYGYYHAKRWKEGNPENVQAHIDEIALNPAHFEKRSAADILATLAHEMAHLWQEKFGQPSRTGYHNRQWAKKMIAIGLVPTDTGKEGGKQTGQHMTHKIMADGAFASACAAFLKTQSPFIPYVDRVGENEEAQRKKSASKTKYTCPVCGLNAWAKPNVSLFCGMCARELEAGEATG